jgi:site-specific DNA-methyltransferase (adenine-specific)
MINLHLGDCMGAMREMPDKAFELAIVDPPYGTQNFTGGGSHTKSNCKFGNLYRENGKQWNTVPGPEYFGELFRVSENQIIWGGNYFKLPPTRCFLIWDKIRYIKNFSRVEYAWTSFDKQPDLFQFCGNGGFITAPEDSPKISPTQKPVALYKWLLKNYAKPGDKILDTHLGSGSIAIACDVMGFDLTGYEIDAEYYQAACERLERHQKQGVFEL